MQRHVGGSVPAAEFQTHVKNQKWLAPPARGATQEMQEVFFRAESPALAQAWVAACHAAVSAMREAEVEEEKVIEAKIAALHEIQPRELRNMRHLAEGAYGVVFVGEYRGTAVAVKHLSEEVTRRWLALGAADPNEAGIVLSNSVTRSFGSGGFISIFILLLMYFCIWVVNFLGDNYIRYCLDFDKAERDKTMRDWHREVTLLRALRHPNIVMFLGTYARQGQIHLVSEFCSRGSLSKLLENHELTLPWSLRGHLALGVARGLAFLHSGQLLHRDIKSDNVVVDEAWTAKLTDFGLSTRPAVFSRPQAHVTLTGKPADDSLTREVGTLQWQAPELFTRADRAGVVLKGSELMRIHYSSAIDIYAFGVVLWELATRQRPYSNVPKAEEWKIREDVAKGFRLTIPEDCPAPWSALIQQCWHKNPNARPSAQEVVHIIEETLEYKLQWNVS